MGEDEQAKLLKKFVDTELVTGNLSSDLNFDQVFEAWKRKQIGKEIKSFEKDWDIDNLYYINQ